MPGSAADICLPSHRSAELHSAASQSSTLPDVGERRRVGPIQSSAEYNSAIRQIENLRYNKPRARRRRSPNWRIRYRSRDEPDARIRMDLGRNHRTFFETFLSLTGGALVVLTEDADVPVERVEFQFGPALSNADVLEFAALVNELSLLGFRHRLVRRQIADGKVRIGFSVESFETRIGG